MRVLVNVCALQLLEEMQAADPAHASAIGIDSVLADPFVQRTKTFLEQESDAFRYVQSLRRDFVFSAFHPMQDASISVGVTSRDLGWWWCVYVCVCLLWV